jgi:hypothetical protein
MTEDLMTIAYLLTAMSVWMIVYTYFFKKTR